MRRRIAADPKFAKQVKELRRIIRNQSRIVTS
jgi:hypothetical protein